jgi:hypothetical protein
MPDRANAKVRAFLCHSSVDKPLARRIARRLGHRGVDVWIDEGKMELGDTLPERLRAEISQSSHFLVLLTANIAQSKWMPIELKAARAQPGIVIIPVIADRNVKTELLDEKLGTFIDDPWIFERELDAVARKVLGYPPSRERDMALLRSDLDEIAKQTPELRGLIKQLTTHGKITMAQMKAMVIREPLRHPAETALIALLECLGPDARRSVALAAGYYFARLGVGYEVLHRQIAIEQDADALRDTFGALGTQIARAEDIEGVCRLFEMVQEPMDTAFQQFVRYNFSRFTEAQQDWAVRYVTLPERGPAGGAGQAVFELFSHMPDNEALRDQFFAWVGEHKFGGKGGVEGVVSVETFYGWMKEAAMNGWAQFEVVMDAFATAFRRLARSPDPNEVCGAVYQLQTAGTVHYVRAKELAKIMLNAYHSEEWKALPVPEKFGTEVMLLARSIEFGRPLGGNTFLKLAKMIDAGAAD